MTRMFMFTGVLLAATATASAAPGLTLPAGKVNLSLNAELEASSDNVGKPLSFSPDVSYGVTDALTVGLVHSKFGITGFRASAGGGLCVAGTDGGCVAVYNNVGAEGWYRLASGELSIAAGGGFHALNLDGGFYAAKVGLKARRSFGKLAVISMPSLLVAVTEREDATGARLNKDTLWVPVVVTHKLDAVTLGLGSGLKGPLSGFGDAWQVPLGFIGQYAIDPSLGVGASLVFGQVLGGGDATGFDYRGVQVWASYTM